jgi:hypothetical protein
MLLAALLLAAPGDITATVIGTELQIRGTADRDNLVFTDHGTIQAHGGTINGAEEIDVPSHESLLIELYGGDDHISLMGSRSVTVRMGDGDDSFACGDSGPSRSLSVEMGRGDDTISFEGVVLPSTRLDMGKGDDVLNLFIAFTESRFVARLGVGNDEVRIRHSGVPDSARFHGGAGFDSFVQVESEGGPRLRGFEFESIE